MHSKKVLPQNRQHLADAISKYLKFLQLVKSASLNTSKSYATDLSQFLSPWGLQVRSVEDDGKNYTVYCDQKGRKVTWSEPELLSLAHTTLLSWGHLKASSRNRKVACLKSLFKWMHQEGYISSPLQDQLRAPKVPQKIPHFISMDEAMSLIKSLKDDLHRGVAVEDELSLFFLIYGGGLRVSEACGLKWRDMDFERSQIKVRGKGEKERMISLPPIANNWLKKATRKGDFVFGNEALNPRKAYEWIRQRGLKAQLLKPLHPHALRHSYATHLLSGGMDLRVLQEALGHSSLVATQKYTHLGVDQLARALAAHHPLSKISK